MDKAKKLYVFVYFRFYLEIISNSQKVRKIKNNEHYISFTQAFLLLTFCSRVIIYFLSIYTHVYKYICFPELYEGKLHISWLFIPIYFSISQDIQIFSCYHSTAVDFIDLHWYNTNLLSIFLAKWSNNIFYNLSPPPGQKTVVEQVLPLIITSLDSLEHFYCLYWFMTLTFLNLWWQWLLKSRTFLMIIHSQSECYKWCSILLRVPHVEAHDMHLPLLWWC